MKNLSKALIKEILRLYIKILPVWINYGWFYVSPKRIEVVPSILKGSYEKYNTQKFDNIIINGQTVVDVGAYIGYDTILFSKLVGDQGSVITFEPDPYNLQLLERNLHLHKVKNTILYKLALGKMIGKHLLYINADDSSLVKTSREDKTARSVKVDTLDNVVKEKKIDLIKIDAQGYELQVLQGARKTLTRNRGIVIHVEFWPQGLEWSHTKPGDLICYLSKLGFKIFYIDKTSGEQMYVKDVSSLIELAWKSPGGFLDLLCKR